MGNDGLGNESYSDFTTNIRKNSNKSLREGEVELWQIMRKKTLTPPVNIF